MTDNKMQIDGEDIEPSQIIAPSALTSTSAQQSSKEASIMFLQNIQLANKKLQEYIRPYFSSYTIFSEQYLSTKKSASKENTLQEAKVARELLKRTIKLKDYVKCGGSLDNCYASLFNFIYSALWISTPEFEQYRFSFTQETAALDILQNENENGDDVKTKKQKKTTYVASINRRRNWKKVFSVLLAAINTSAGDNDSSDNSNATTAQEQLPDLEEELLELFLLTLKSAHYSMAEASVALQVPLVHSINAEKHNSIKEYLWVLMLELLRAPALQSKTRLVMLKEICYYLYANNLKLRKHIRSWMMESLTIVADFFNKNAQSFYGAAANIPPSKPNSTNSLIPADDDGIEAPKSDNKPMLLPNVNQDEAEEEDGDIIKCKKVAGAPQLLEIIYWIFKGCSVPLKLEYNQLFKIAVLQLNKQSGMLGEMMAMKTLVDKELNLCVEAFLEKASNVAPAVMLFIISSANWPVFFPKQCVLQLNLLQTVLEQANATDLVKCGTQLVTFLVEQCFTSLHYAVAQRSMMMLTSKTLLPLIVRSDCRKFQKDALPALLNIAATHWNDTSRQMAYQILSNCFNLDELHDYLATSKQYKQLQAKFNAFEESEQKLQKIKQQKEQQKKEHFSCELYNYAIEKQVGTGSYSKVYKCLFMNHDVDMRHWEAYALKVMDMKLLSTQHYVDNAIREIEILNSFDHPNIIRLSTVFVDADKGQLFLALNWCAKGDVFSVLSKLGSTDLEWATAVAAQTANALDVLHRHNIVHGDIKPENILLDSSGSIKLTDFGSAEFVDPSCSNFGNSNSSNSSSSAEAQPIADRVKKEITEYMKKLEEGTLVHKRVSFIRGDNPDSLDNALTANQQHQQETVAGTIDYLAPEIIECVIDSTNSNTASYRLITGAKCTKQTDWWAFGCFVFQLLAGRLPFYADSNQQLLKKIKSLESITDSSDFEKAIQFPSSWDDEIHKDAKDLIMRLFAVKAADRMEFDELKQHKFFAAIDWNGIEGKEMPQVKMGAVKAADIDVKLRQRKRSMMLTKALPQSYTIDNVLLQPIIELDEK